MAFCSACGAQMPEGATVCPACNRSASPAATVVQGKAGGLADNVAGMLAYVTIIPAIIFLLIEPYNKSKFVRFHSFQSIFFCLAVAAIHIALSVLGVVPFLLFITFPLHALVSLAAFVIWIILLIKANQGQMYKLPYIGDLAEKQANS
jgi:uncharacterized membrane protein